MRVIKEPIKFYNYRLGQLQRAYDVKQAIKDTPVRLGYYESKMNPSFNKGYLLDIGNCLYECLAVECEGSNLLRVEKVANFRMLAYVNEAFALILELEQQDVVRWYDVMPVFDVINVAIGFVNQSIAIVRAMNKKAR